MRAISSMHELIDHLRERQKRISYLEGFFSSASEGHVSLLSVAKIKTLIGIEITDTLNDLVELLPYYKIL